MPERTLATLQLLVPTILHQLLPTQVRIFVLICLGKVQFSGQQLPGREQLPSANWLRCARVPDFPAQVLALRRHELRGLPSQGNGKDLPRQRRILLFGNQRAATKRPCRPIHADLHGLQEQGCVRQHAEPKLPGENTFERLFFPDFFRTATPLTPSAGQRTTTASPSAASAAPLTTAPKNRAGGTPLTEANGRTKETTPDIKVNYFYSYS